MKIRTRNATAKSTKPSEHRRERHYQTRKVNLRDQVLVGDETIARFGKGVREELPWHEGAVNENRIRNAVRGHASETAEEETEDKHQEERLDNRPSQAERSLLVAHFDITPNEKIKQLAIIPNFPQVERFPRFRWADRERLFHGPRPLCSGYESRADCHVIKRCLKSHWLGFAA